MATDNTTIAGRIFLNGTNDFQQRVPNPSIAGMAATSKYLLDPMNRMYLNQFMDAFINRVGQQEIHNKSWENPLTPFKGPTMTYGSTLQESAVKWLKAHSYNVDDDTLLKVSRPEAAVWYHTINRQDRYDISVELPELEMAFADEYGLNRLISAIMTTPRNSDNYDEYKSMMQQIAWYEENWGFFTVALDEPSDDETGKAFLKELRARAYKLKYPTALYSPISAEFGIPVFAQPSELILFITPDAMASVDVDTLASVFQLDKADIKYRTIVVDEFPVDGMYALLTTDQFFVVRDKVYQNDSFYNPQTMCTNYYLHHWELISASPFVPAIAYIDGGTTTNIQTITQTVSGVEISAAETSIEPGGTTQLSVNLTGDITANDYGLEVRPDAVTWEIEANGFELNMRTRVDRLGVFHLQRGGDITTGDTVTITGTAAYTNPSGTTTQYANSVTITVA